MDRLLLDRRPRLLPWPAAALPLLLLGPAAARALPRWVLDVWEPPASKLRLLPLLPASGTTTGSLLLLLLRLLLRDRGSAAAKGVAMLPLAALDWCAGGGCVVVSSGRCCTWGAG